MSFRQVLVKNLSLDGVATGGQSPIAPILPFVTPRTRYTRERRDRLRELLGWKCARCDCRQHLQFDCIVSPGKDHHSLSWRDRLKFNELQFFAGNLQLLCPHHHVEKTLDDIARRRALMLLEYCPHCGKDIPVSYPSSNGGPLPVVYQPCELFAVRIATASIHTKP